MAELAETLEIAVQHHQAGRLRHAEHLYHLILQSDPNNPTALHLLGVIAHQEAKHDVAIDVIGKAIKHNPQIPQFHNTLGLVFQALGKFEEAIIAYKRAVSIKPDYAEAYNNLGLALSAQSRFAEAIANYERAKRFGSECPEPYYNLANALQQQGQCAEAIEDYKQAICLRPNFAEAYSNLGTALKDCGQLAEAVKNYKHALQLKPDCAEIHHNMGIAQREQGKSAEAIENYKQAIHLKPDYAEAYNNLGGALKDCGHCAEAIVNYERAIQLKPDYAEAQWNQSLALLLSGRIAEGWKEYQQRYDRLNTLTYPYHYQEPLWDGSSFVGKRLFVRYQQGLGDNIQFVRYLPMVKARGGTVIYETKKPLLGLLQDFSEIDELVEASPDGKPAVGFDFYVSLMDLPRIFGTTLETIPAEVPYIHADPSKVKYWQSRLSGPDLKVGIVWAGKPTHRNDLNRSCPLEHFAVLAGIEGVRLYGLQKGKAAAQVEELAGKMTITNLGAEFKDFADSAAAIENLDLVISVDTAVRHLAGAMGKPVWALLPFAPEWRWMLNRQDSPWYPTMRLFRQKKWGQWIPVFQRIAEELRIVSAKHRIGSHKLNYGKEKMIPTIIPYYKNKDQLEKCIAHLRKQTVEVEIFIRDNSEDNVNFTAAINEGIRKYLDQDCKYMIILNQDMYLERLAAEEMVTFMDAHPECGIGAPLLLHSQNPEFVICGGSYEAFPLGKHQGGELSKFTEDEQLFWANGVCMILRKEMIQEIGLLDENFVFIGSDSDYCFTARSRGWQVWRIAGARGIHEHGASGASANEDIEMLKIKDMTHFGKKWLTGELYKEMAYEGHIYTPEIIGHIMNQLRDAKSELESCHPSMLDAR